MQQFELILTPLNAPCYLRGPINSLRIALSGTASVVSILSKYFMNISILCASSYCSLVSGIAFRSGSANVLSMLVSYTVLELNTTSADELYGNIFTLSPALTFGHDSSVASALYPLNWLSLTMRRSSLASAVDSLLCLSTAICVSGLM